MNASKRLKFENDLTRGLLLLENIPGLCTAIFVRKSYSWAVHRFGFKVLRCI